MNRIVGKYFDLTFFCKYKLHKYKNKELRYLTSN